MKKLLISLYFIANSAIACIDDRGVYYDLMLSQNPNLTCIELITKANRAYEETRLLEKHGSSVTSIPATEIAQRDIDRIRTLWNEKFAKQQEVEARYEKLKKDVLDGNHEFNQDEFDSIHQEIALLEKELSQLYDQSLAAQRTLREIRNTEREERLRIKRLVYAQDKKLETTKKEKRHEKLR